MHNSNTISAFQLLMKTVIPEFAKFLERSYKAFLPGVVCLLAV